VVRNDVKEKRNKKSNRLLKQGQFTIQVVFIYLLLGCHIFITVYCMLNTVQ